MNKISKISSYVLYGLLVISALFTALLMFGGVTPGDLIETPLFTDEILNWTYILVLLSVAIVIGFEAYKVVTHPSDTKKSLYTAGGMILLGVVTYLMADGTPMEILGYEGTDNVPSVLKITDMGLFSFYGLTVIAVVAILVSEITRFTR
ncbi:MAG: hypothetical protein KBG80_06625 [Breznakibacter sp.]|jgi:hypothetical protein|nr:hypothetical protein [Breznakibacter sp.]